MLGIALAATLLGTAATLLLLHGLLAPLAATADALRAYLSEREVPDLPSGYRDEAGVLMSDTVEVIRSLDAHMTHLSTHDPLTGLGNESDFRDRIAHAFDGARRTGQPFAVLLLGIDAFSALNVVYGRIVGDRVLIAVAEQLRGVAG